MPFAWRPVSETPATEGEYICSGIWDGNRWVGGLEWDGNDWGDPDAGWVCDNITHWSPDWPEPPSE
mgnify:FL=1